MRIVFISSFDEKSGGGTGRIAHEIAEAFSNFNHDVLLILPSNETETIKVKPNYTKLCIKSLGEEELRIPLLTPQNLKTITDTLDLFNPDIVHAHDPGVISLFSQYWCFKYKVPFFYTSHILPSKFLDFGTGEYAKFIQVLPTNNILNTYLKHFHKKCFGIIALNKVAERDLLNYVDKSKIHIISNGRNLKKYSNLKIPLINKYPIELIFIGHLSKRKNQIFLIKVMKYLPTEKYKLTLIGKPIDNKILDTLKTFTKQQKINNVTFYGSVGHEKIPALFEKSHLLVSASTLEVQSLVVIEALASGTPVIGLSNETIDELITPTNGVYLEADTTPGEFARAIEKFVLENKNNYQKFCETCRNSVEDFSWDKIVEKTAKAYQNHLTPKPPKKKLKLDFNEAIELSFLDIKDNILNNSKFYSYMIFISIATTIPLTPISLLNKYKQVLSKLKNSLKTH